MMPSKMVDTSDAIMSSVSNVLSDMIAEHGVDVISERTGCTKSYLRDFAAGRRPLTLAALVTLSAAGVLSVNIRRGDL